LINSWISKTENTGDFSFALSLAAHHQCKEIFATSYDSKDTVYDKYPQAKLNIDQLLASRPVKSGEKRKRDDGSGEEEADEEAETDNRLISKSSSENASLKVLFSIDARKLGISPAGGGKEVRNGICRRTGGVPAWQVQGAPKHGKDGPGGGPWDIICFNFPHVGGFSTDVNRQARANQELLVAFFKVCAPLLSFPAKNIRNDLYTSDQDEDEDDYAGGENDDSDDDLNTSMRKPTTRTEPGQVLVTIFEGEPYTLWNVRDLARHAGLRVVRSFKFPWTSYPGYAHARTLGEIEGRNGGKGGWRGEERAARTYVFEVQGHGDYRKGSIAKASGRGNSRKGGKDKGKDSEDSNGG
jgi:25S rRNA (uracil2634-N3)-methyltransferase